MRRSLSATAARTVRRAVTWRPKVKGAATLDIRALISPLRYDVVIRASIFDHIAARPAEQSLQDYLDSSLEHPYAVWFREIEARRFRPWLLSDEAALRADYRERVSRAVATFASFSQRGFDAAYPVTLRSTRGPQVTDTGLTFQHNLHVGDGGHRLALLMRSGQQLLPEYYRIDPRPRPVLDNTSLLLRHLPISEDEYAAFVAPGYVQGPWGSTLDDLERAVGAQAPERLGEFGRIVQAHQEARQLFLSGDNHG